MIKWMDIMLHTYTSCTHGDIENYKRTEREREREGERERERERRVIKLIADI